MLANAAAVDAAIYTVEPPYCIDTDWPALPYRAPVNVPTIAKKARKPRPQIRVVNLDGVVQPATDDTLATVLQPAPVGFCLNWEAAKLDGLLALHKYTERTKLRIPMGQRVLSPLHVRWSSVQQDFVYSFQIMENATKWYVESELVEVKE